MEVKTCKTCKQEQPIEEFYKMPKLRGGHSHICRTCLRSDKRPVASELNALLRTWHA